MKRIVLVGAGHAHIVALRHFAKYPPAAELFVVNDGPHAWYTGALPALIRGDITEERARLDIRALAARCGADFINARYTGFDSGAVHLDARPDLPFDTLSLSIGAAPKGGVKPVPAFLARLRGWDGTGACLGILGAGAAGVELALALRRRLGPGAAIFLCGAGSVLQAAPPGARRVAAAALRAANIPVVAALPHMLDATLHAYTPEPGLIIRPTLQLAGHDHIFATGDCAKFVSPLPRSGAVAVRQGHLLAYNLTHLKMKHFRPPAATLAILSLDASRGLAWLGKFWAHGGLPLLIKTWIDRRWVRV